MGLRRILIGLVAVVGVSLPIGPDGVSGFTAVRDWAIVQTRRLGYVYSPPKQPPHRSGSESFLERGHNPSRDAHCRFGLV